MRHCVESDHVILNNAKDIYTAGILSLKKSKTVTFDLTKIKNVDTSGIAVLFAWWQYAVNTDITCQFELSESVSESLRMYDIELP